MREQPIKSRVEEPHKNPRFLPREHGATAMLLTPIVCAAILAREWRWGELATLAAAIAAKDPMVVLARQGFVWTQRHPETMIAVRWLAVWIAVLILCGLVLVHVWPMAAIMALGLGVSVFSAAAVTVNVKNRQRSTRSEEHTSELQS